MPTLRLIITKTSDARVQATESMLVKTEKMANKIMKSYDHPLNGIKKAIWYSGGGYPVTMRMKHA